MGGAIDVESASGEGSTFWIEVPATEAHPRRPGADDAATPGIATPEAPPSKTLLWIGDDASRPRLLTRMVARRLSVRLISAESGARGPDMASEHRPDLILLDLHLPDLGGDEVLKQLAADPVTTGIPVVMLSADALPATREQLLAAGARAFLTKPIEVRAFLTGLDEILKL